MNELDLFESLRPTVRPMSAEQRSAMRAQLFGGDAQAWTSFLEREDAADVESDLQHHWDAEVAELRAPATRRRRLLGVAAVIVGLLGVGGIWMSGTQRSQPAPPVHEAPTSDAATPVAVPAEPPQWYSTIRPLLPEGFDQIALTLASPEVVGFKAFRNGTRQMLDVTVVLQPGYEAKATGEVPTYTDDHGTYIEGTSSVTLTTPDDRRVSVRCGLSPIGGGAVGAVGLADSVRDYCGEGFDDLGLDFKARRALAVRLAGELSGAVVTPTFGQPVTAPETPATLAAVTTFAGDDRMMFPAEQHDGVLRSTGLDAGATGPWDTELTVVHGVWPPRAADAAPANRLDGPTPPGARFHLYDDVAVAFVVADDGTGYHIITSELAEDHLDRLGTLLDELVTQPASDTSGDADPTITSQPPPTSTSTTGPGAATALDRAMVPDDQILLVDGSGDAQVGADLSEALTRSGLTVIGLVPSSGEVVDETVAYTRDSDSAAALNDLVTAVPIRRAEGPIASTDRLEHTALLDDADIVIVVGRDLADADWRTSTESLVAPSTGRLLVLDATGSEQGRRRAVDAVASLRQDGVDVSDVVTAARSFDEPAVFMPIGASTRWTFAVAKLAGIGGFDTWAPDLLDGALPDDVTAVLVIGGL